jgi:phosphatidate cytidylyltransferase
VFSQRIISSVILIVLICFAIFIRWFFALMMLGLSLAGLCEFFAMLKNRGIGSHRYLGIAIGMAIPLSLLLEPGLAKAGDFLFVTLAFLFLLMVQLLRRDNSAAVVEISVTVFGILYVAWLFSFIIRVRNLPQGVAYLSLLLLATKLGDIGAYLVGSRFGKTPLIPAISPKKSVEGALGGLLFSVLGALSMRQFINFSYGQLVFIGLFLGILSQLGDLSESLIKRSCQVKDAGRILPGLGGALDSMDSLLFTAPAFYFYLSNLAR